MMALLCYAYSELDTIDGRASMQVLETQAWDECAFVDKVK